MQKKEEKLTNNNLLIVVRFGNVATIRFGSLYYNLEHFV